MERKRGNIFLVVALVIQAAYRLSFGEKKSSLFCWPLSLSCSQLLLTVSKTVNVAISILNA